MTALVFTSADFDAAVDLTLKGVDVEGRSGGLDDDERAKIVQEFRGQYT